MNATCKSRISLHLKPLAVAISLLAVAGHAAAVGQGTVAAGAATIGSNGATTTINQSSDRAVLNWNNFDIGASERVQINQPSATSAILNRVNSSKLTQIDGALNSNGRVFVVNPNGIVVGKTGQINASSAVLSTLDFTDDNFINGDRFYQGSTGKYIRVDSLTATQNAGAAGAAVVNNGTIAASNGVALLGAQVVNTGDITAGTQLTLAAGSNAYLTLANGGFNSGLSSSINNNQTPYANNTIVNEGTLTSTGFADVRLLSGASNAGSNEVIRNTGSISAITDDPVGGGGKIAISAPSGTTYLGGAVSGRVISVSSGDVVLDGALNAAGPGYDPYGNGGPTISINAGELNPSGIGYAKPGSIVTTANASRTVTYSGQ